MSELQQFRKRHYFTFKDNRKYVPKWNEMRRKRMYGMRIDPDFNKFRYLISNYMFRKINSDSAVSGGFSDKEFELLISLVHENRGITLQDMLDFPLGWGVGRCKRCLGNFKKWGIVERFEGHGSTHHRGIVYKLTKKARKWISDMDAMQLGVKKIPLDDLCADRDFMKRNVSGEKKKGPGWYRNVVKFNEWVEENINKCNYKELIGSNNE